MEVFPLKETKFIEKQAPNRQETWSKSQKARLQAMVGPRFLQKDMSKQPSPEAAIELIGKEPIIFTKTNKAICNGKNGDTPGHPQIFINLDNEAEFSTCGYCGQRFQQEPKANE